MLPERFACRVSVPAQEPWVRMGSRVGTIGFEVVVVVESVAALVSAVRGGLVFKAHRLVYHSTLGSRVIKKKRSTAERACQVAVRARGG